MKIMDKMNKMNIIAVGMILFGFATLYSVEIRPAVFNKSDMTGMGCANYQFISSTSGCTRISRPYECEAGDSAVECYMMSESTSNADPKSGVGYTNRDPNCPGMAYKCSERGTWISISEVGCRGSYRKASVDTGADCPEEEEES